MKIDELSKEQLKEAYRVSLDTRQFEIELFWKRSLFFWGFIAVAFAGYAQLIKGNPLLALVLALFGSVCSFAWILANRGSKYWQENWEEKVKALEAFTTGPLFESKAEINTDRFRLLSAGKYSVSRLVILLSSYVFVLWLVVVIHNMFMIVAPGVVAKVSPYGAWVLLAVSFVFVIGMLFACRSSGGKGKCREE